jgi:hypothetical protein
MNSKNLKFGYWEKGEKIKSFHNFNDFLRHFHKNLHRYKKLFKKDIEDVRGFLKSIKG